MTKHTYESPPPWVFTGKALYQLHLIRARDARAHVPKDLRLVEAFGYTLGGVYMARYDSSPCGKLDEVVILGGLVWNPPTSCAWASRVYVDSKEAREHGVKTCGLPSRIAKFDDAVTTQGETRRGVNWWSGKPRKEADPKVKIIESKRELCEIIMPNEPSLKGPRISMSLPSFSGRTKKLPDLLKYSLQMHANVRLSSPIKISVEPNSSEEISVVNILQSKPLLCIAFDNMRMAVGAPSKVTSKTL